MNLLWGGHRSRTVGRSPYFLKLTHYLGWVWVDEASVSVPSSGDILAKPGSGTAVLCRRYTAVLVGQGWQDSRQAICCERTSPCSAD